MYIQRFTSHVFFIHFILYVIPLVFSSQKWRDRAPPPPTPPRTPPGVLQHRLPLVRGAGRPGWARWKSSVSEGSRISAASTQERSSGPYPSQSTRYWKRDLTCLEFKSILTLYAGIPSMSRGGGGSQADESPLWPEESSNLLIQSLCLAIRVRMITWTQAHINAQLFAKGPPHPGCKLGASIWHNVLWYAKVVEHMLEESVGCL